MKKTTGRVNIGVDINNSVLHVLSLQQLSYTQMEKSSKHRIFRPGGQERTRLKMQIQELAFIWYLNHQTTWDSLDSETR